MMGWSDHVTLNMNTCVAANHLMTYRQKADASINKPQPCTPVPAGRHVSNLFSTLFTYKSSVLVHKRGVA